MDRDAIIQRLETLGEKLNDAPAGSKEAHDIKEELIDLWRMLNEDEKVINERLDRNRRFDLDEMRFEAERREAKEKNDTSRLEAIITVIKTAMTIGGAFLLLIGTLIVEDKTIISQKGWALITKLFPRI